MRAARWVLVLAAAATFAAVGACTFGIDPDGAAHFSCDTAKDCGPGYECRPQAESDRGLCYPLDTCADNEEACDGKDDDCNGLVDDVTWAGAACDTTKPGLCAPGHRVCTDGVEACTQDLAARDEQCNDLDDDCDGVPDDGIDLSADDKNCGACGHMCPNGTACAFGICIERACADGVDNDGDEVTDCDDGDCLGRACSDQEPDFVCGLLPLLPDAGGMDGGEADAGDVDAGGMDGGVMDGGELDAGADAGVMDAGLADAGLIDGGAMDAGDPDAGPMDAGDLDAGFMDGGELDAGTMDGGDDTDAGAPIPQCVPPETNCANGLDDDGDGQIDCADPGCDLQPCGDGGVCAQLTCQ